MNLVKRIFLYFAVPLLFFVAVSTPVTAQHISGISQLGKIASVEKQIDFLLRNNPGLTRTRASNIVTKINIRKATPPLLPAHAPQALRTWGKDTKPTLVAPTTQQLTTQVTQRVIAANPLPAYGKVHREEYHTLMDNIGNAHDLALAFPKWLNDVGSYIMSTPETTQAIEALRYAVASGSLDDSLFHVLHHLYTLPLGPQLNGTFLRVAFRGPNPRIPMAKDFHVVAELPEVCKFNAQKALALHLPHIAFNSTHRTLTGIVFLPGITPNEIDQLFAALTPAGYEIRLGAHEFGIVNDEISQEALSGQLHVHFEKISAFTDRHYHKDIIYSIPINAHPITRGKTPHQIMHLYHYLLRKYMDEYMVSYTL